MPNEFVNLIAFVFLFSNLDMSLDTTKALLMIPKNQNFWAIPVNYIWVLKNRVLSFQPFVLNLDYEFCIVVVFIG